MALEHNPAAERRGKAPCKSNIRTADSAVSKRSSKNFRRRPLGQAALFVLPPKSPKHSGCVERANAVSRYEFHQSCAGELSVGAPDIELAQFELLCNAYRPHQALGQMTPMQAYNQNFD